MTTIPNGHEEKCTQCGSKAVNVEWDERVNATQVQYLWRCLNCKNEFITQVASDQKPISDAEITTETRRRRISLSSRATLEACWPG